MSITGNPEHSTRTRSEVVHICSSLGTKPPAADILAAMQSLTKTDSSYSETLRISKRGMDFINGAEATLRAAAVSL